MRSNFLARPFGITAFGESHSPALGIVLEDILPGIDFPHNELMQALKMRRPGLSEFSSERQEEDCYQIVSGVFEGKTTGMPICLLFWNTDAKAHDYGDLAEVFRPSHADYAWYKKFKIFDYRGGGRASGRETISRVAASKFINNLLPDLKIEFQTIRVGNLHADHTDSFQALSADNPFCWAGDTYDTLQNYLRSVKANHDTAGGIVRVKISSVPAGLGDPVFAKLSANLAQAVMSVGSVKGVSIGDWNEGCDYCFLGSTANDYLDANGFVSNHCGGILGGISSGQPIIMTVLIKPPASHGLPQKTVSHTGEPVMITVKGRHDVCHIPRILPVLESMIKLVLSDALAYQKLITGESTTMADYRDALDKLDEDILISIYKRKALVQQVTKYKTANAMEFRDPIREQQLQQRWLQIATVLGIDQKNTPALLDLILEICRT